MSRYQAFGSYRSRDIWPAEEEAAVRRCRGRRADRQLHGSVARGGLRSPCQPRSGGEVWWGVQTLEVAGGVQRDYLLVQYAGGEDKVYVPTDQIALLQKYIGMEDSPPRLNRLGGTEWTRTKAKARESVQDMAEDLLRLYAARESVKGYAFSPDTVWQQEFEDLFPYEETPDQWRAIVDVKRTWKAHANGQTALRGCGIWQDRGGAEGCVQGRGRRQTGRGARAYNDPCAAAL